MSSDLLLASLATGRVQIITQDLTTLHHEFHALEFRNISQRVATYGDEVGEFAAFDRTDVSFPSHHLRVHDGRSSYDLRGSHAELDHVFELFHLRSMREGADSGAESHFDARGDGAPEVWFGYFSDRVPAVFLGVVLPIQLVVIEGGD